MLATLERLESAPRSHGEHPFPQAPMTVRYNAPPCVGKNFWFVRDGIDSWYSMSVTSPVQSIKTEEHRVFFRTRNSTYILTNLGG